MDKTTLKQWFTRGKKPTAAQFAAWMDSYWHKDEPLPAAAVEGLFQLLDTKAVIDDNATTSTTTYSSAKIKALIEEIAGALQPEKDVVPVSSEAELLQIETPDIEVLYLTLDTNELFAWNGMTFVLVNDNSALYIRSLNELDRQTDVGEYSVVWTEIDDTDTTKGKCSAWSLSVSANGDTLTQYLANKNGYYRRTYANGQWGLWTKKEIAYKSDIGNGSLQLKMNGAPYKSGRLDDAGEIVWRANSEDKCVLDFDNATFMPDFAWWQTYHANIGASVLMTGQYTVPFVKRNDDKRMLFEVGFVRTKPISDTVYETPADKMGKLHLPERCIKIYFYTPYNGANFTFTLTHSGEQVTIVPTVGKTMGEFSIPNGWAGQTVEVSVRVDSLYHVDDTHQTESIHLYATDVEVLSSNVHTYWNEDMQQTRRYNEWEHLQRYGNKFWLVRWNAEDERWRLLPYRQGTVRVRRHSLECKISATESHLTQYYTDDYGNTLPYSHIHFVDRDSYREFSVPTISPIKNDNIYPAFVRAKIRAAYRHFMWLTNIGDGDLHHQRAGFRLRPDEMPVWPGDTRTPTQRHSFYLDVMYADMQCKINRVHRNAAWRGRTCNRRIHRRPLIKSMCAHWRKITYDGGGLVGAYGFTDSILRKGAQQILGRWVFIGYVKPPRVQF